MSTNRDLSVLHRSASKALNAKAQLNELTARVNDAADTYRLARDRAAKPHEHAERVTHDLLAYHHAVAFRQRDADPDEAYRQSTELLQQIESEGLILVPVDPRRASAGFRLVNPNLVPAVEATEASARVAARDRDAFARENATLLQEHEDRQRMTKFKDALASDDPDTFLAAVDGLAGKPDTRANSLTTDDLAVTR
jgi:hypothetical protein